MMRLPPFTLHTPQSVSEASQLLAQHGPAATVVAGGTDLWPNMKRRQQEPGVVVSLQRIPHLRGIRRDADGATVIGALTTLRELAAGDGVHPALARAAASVSSPQIRNAGTVGGNLCVDTRCTYFVQSDEWRQALGSCLKGEGDTCWVAPGGNRCWSISSSDLAPVAIALNAEATLVGPDSERTIPVADLYRDDGLEPITRRHDEILTHVRIPPSEDVRATYRKVRRRGTIDFPMLGVATSLRLAADGTCTEARIVLGAVASAPLRAGAAEALLVGRMPTDEVIDEAAEAAAKPAKPLDNADLTHYYRKWVIPVHVRRALRELVGDPAPAA